MPDEAEATLRDTARICLSHGVPFKFLRSTRALSLMADKHMNRSGAGKFIAVYPPDDAVFQALAKNCPRPWPGAAAPTSSATCGSGTPLSTRATALRAPGPGAPTPTAAGYSPCGYPLRRLVPDERGVVFRTPSWVEVPSFLRPHLAARAAARDDTFPYTVTEALQFSNAGGIYLAKDRETGRRVVLREARPHRGLDGAGDDAVTRLHREHRAPTTLAGLTAYPRCTAYGPSGSTTS
ncbi:Serine/threonine protein kinase OS=Streptomyces microflavus OX=1919 GN=Smic_25690 PE=4 SV=1 [Streptomyces microflavus]